MTEWYEEGGTRLAAVAGTFYPSDPREIDGILQQWLASAPAQAASWYAALVPHAGWSYSGPVAAQVLSRVRLPATVLVLCPKHHAEGGRWAVAPWHRWQIPGGSLKTDVELNRQLVQQVPEFTFDARPHRREHAIEVLLPMLAHLAPRVRLVGITIGHGELDECARIAQGLAAVLDARREPWMLLVSSDMNHFATEPENRRLDTLALEKLEKGDADGLYTTCCEQHISMCGMPAAVIALKTLQQLDLLNETDTVAYATSGEVSGDRQRVVGYAGMLLGRAA